MVGGVEDGKLKASRRNGGGRDLPGELRAAGLIVALSAPFGCAEYMTMTRDSGSDDKHRARRATAGGGGDDGNVS